MTEDSHYDLVSKTKGDASRVLYLEDQESNLTSFGSVRKVHKANNQKGINQLISAYDKAFWMSPGLANVIQKVVKVYLLTTSYVTRVEFFQRSCYT